MRFDVPPEEAIDYFRRKQVITRKEFSRLSGEARSAAFTVSGIYRKDVLEGFKEEIAQALEAGTPQREVIKGFREILEGAGHRDLGTWHLENIFRTNAQMAYGVGRRRALEDVAGDLPFWVYHAVMDDRTRPAHAALDGVTLPANHEFWDDHFPPWDFACRCSVTATHEIPAGYNHSNPSGQAQLAYDERGVPVKAEYDTAVYDLSAGKFTGVPRQAGLREAIEDAAERAKESKRQRYTTPQQVLNKEKEIRFDKQESLHFFDRSGKLLHSFKGKEDQVSYELSKAEEKIVRGGIDTHNHPSSRSFSLKDILDAARLGQVETRIISKIFSYSMRPPGIAWTGEIATKIESAFYETRDKVVRELQSAVRSGELSTSEAKLEERHTIWQRVARRLGLRYTRKKL